VLAAGQEQSSRRRALETLLPDLLGIRCMPSCGDRGMRPHDAEDPDPEFFARFSGQGILRAGQPGARPVPQLSPGLLKHLLSEQWRQAGRSSMAGAGATLVSWDKPDGRGTLPVRAGGTRSHQRRSMTGAGPLTLLEQALAQLGQEQSAIGKGGCSPN